MTLFQLSVGCFAFLVEKSLGISILAQSTRIEFFYCEMFSTRLCEFSEDVDFRN